MIDTAAMIEAALRGAGECGLAPAVLVRHINTAEARRF
jgi:hypothetical protein